MAPEAVTQQSVAGTRPSAPVTDLASATDDMTRESKERRSIPLDITHPEEKDTSTPSTRTDGTSAGRTTPSELEERKESDEPPVPPRPAGRAVLIADSTGEIDFEAMQELSRVLPGAFEPLAGEVLEKVSVNGLLDGDSSRVGASLGRQEVLVGVVTYKDRRSRYDRDLFEVDASMRLRLLKYTDTLTSSFAVVHTAGGGVTAGQARSDAVRKLAEEARDALAQ